MKKIGIECESIEGKNPVWGIGRIIIKLLKEISQRPELEKNYKFTLYFKDNVPDFEFLRLPVFEIKRVPIPFFKNRLFPIYYFALLPMRLWLDRPDVMFWPNYMLPIITSGRSVVMLTEDVYYEAHSGKLPFRYRLSYLIFCWWAAKFATKIMAISETSKKNLVRLYNIKPERIFVNYLGITPPQTKNHKLETKNYLLFVGQAFPRRHFKEILLAFEKIASEFPDLKLIAVGPDKYPEPTIEPLVNNVNLKLGRESVIHKDYVSNDELDELYANAKALIYVSDKEAFGLPPMEALSFGVPPIVKDNKLGHELFGEYAFYSKSGNVDDIAYSVRQALTNSEKVQNIKNSGLEFVKKYNWRSFANRWIKIIDEL